MLYRRITNSGNFNLTSICQFPEISNIPPNLFISQEYIMNSRIAEAMGFIPFKPEFSSGSIQAFVSKLLNVCSKNCDGLPCI